MSARCHSSSGVDAGWPRQDERRRLLLEAYMVSLLVARLAGAYDMIGWARAAARCVRCSWAASRHSIGGVSWSLGAFANPSVYVRSVLPCFFVFVSGCVR